MRSNIIICHDCKVCSVIRVRASVSVTFWCAAFSPSSILFSSSNPLSSLQVRVDQDNNKDKDKVKDKDNMDNDEDKDKVLS